MRINCPDLLYREVIVLCMDQRSITEDYDVKCISLIPKNLFTDYDPNRLFNILHSNLV